MKKIISCLPKILSFGFIIFLSLFALDVFNEYEGFQAVVPFLIHLLPSIILFLLTIISLKHEFVGAFTFLIFAFCYILLIGLDEDLSLYLLIAGPAILISILFFVSWVYKKNNKNI